MIPSEVTSALHAVSRAFTEALPKSAATRDTAPSDKLAARAADDAARAAEAAADAVADAAEPDGTRQIPSRRTQPEPNGDKHNIDHTNGDQTEHQTVSPSRP